MVPAGRCGGGERALHPVDLAATSVQPRGEQPPRPSQVVGAGQLGDERGPAHPLGGVGGALAGAARLLLGAAGLLPGGAGGLLVLSLIHISEPTRPY